MLFAFLNGLCFPLAWPSNKTSISGDLGQEVLRSLRGEACELLEAERGRAGFGPGGSKVFSLGTSGQPTFLGCYIRWLS